ncbi:hypothetical protein GLOIN_2v1480046 [Rhizophagus irregularis DAOM 181602=DAOM 197198]|nr:hypothetical protein GLOIN_2v1480046 [Rhizophagus irregularis DAOM 181602=DAOM 197198]
MLLNLFKPLDEIEDRCVEEEHRGGEFSTTGMIRGAIQEADIFRCFVTQYWNYMQSSALIREMKFKDSSSMLKHGNKIGGTPFSIWICDASIRIYKINYDGIYRFLVANVVIPTEQAQFIEALKHRISEVLTVIASNTPSRSTYGRMPTSSPKLIKVTITGLQPN